MGSIVHIGMDFNVRRMCAVCGFLIVKEGRKRFLAFNEYTGYNDTPELIEVIKYDFPFNQSMVASTSLNTAILLTSCIRIYYNSINRKSYLITSINSGVSL